MNNPPNADWVRRLQEMEAQIERDRATSDSVWLHRYRATQTWFQTLSKEGKIVASIAGAIALFFALKMTIALVSLLVSLAVLGGLAYIAYRLFVASPSE